MWERVRLGDVLGTTSGGTPSRTKSEFFENGNIPWVLSGDLYKKEIRNVKNYITDLGLKHSSAKLFPKNTLLIAMYGATIGQVGILRMEASTNQAICGILPNADFSPEFLYYYFLSIQKDLTLKGLGNAQPNISQEIIKNLTIPIPPLPVQRRIAETLDKADALRRKDKELLKKYDELAQAIFIDMFGDPVKNEKGWEVKKLGEMSLRKGQYGSGSAAVPYDGNIRYIRITDITEDGELNPNNKVSLKESKLHEYILEHGDLLFARSGATVGKTFLYDKDKHGKCAFAGYLIRFKLNLKTVNPAYLFWFTKSDYYISWVANSQNAVAQPNINAKQYGDLNILIPPLALQQAFARKIGLINQLKAKANAEKSEELFQSLLQGVFNKESLVSD